MIEHFTSLDGELAVGSYPSDLRDARFLAELNGVSGLVSLQSDVDLEERDLDWETLQALYSARGIAARRVKVTDFDRMDLARHLDEAVAAVAELTGAGRKTYVHCNHGLNRSPCTVTAFLVAHRGLSLPDAIAWIEARHRCILYYDVLEAWAAGR
jgi:protein-tyrosine phosphatase